MPTLRERLVELLLSKRLIEQPQLEEALRLQQTQGGSLQRLLIDRGFVKEADLLAVMSQGLGMPLISLTRFNLDTRLKHLIPRELAKRYQMIPMSCIGRTLSVAMADPLDVFALDTVTTLTGLSVSPMLTTSKDIADAIDILYGTGVEETLKEIVKESETTARATEAEHAEDGADANRLLKLTEAQPVIRMTDILLNRAIRMRASDVLIEPMEQRVRVRFRIDGTLREDEAPPRQFQHAVVSRIKVMANLNIAEHRLPQDGHFSFSVEGRPIDFRVSVLPSSFGEKIVLRILDKSQVNLDLDALGFDPGDLQQLKRCAQRPHGMLLTTGPTGSGKTTTLYSLLKYIDRPEKNLVTVEDPVEYHLEGINQVTVHAEIGLSFAQALRSILRQDPDVILVGEIRDAETADMAVKSALTGHLVLSTLHTNSAAGTIVRLINMGMEPFLINSCLMAVIGQRLVRTICARCKAPYTPPKTIAARLGLLDAKGKPLEVAKGTGCSACAQSGYRGREVIAEVLVLTPEIRDAIVRRMPERTIEEAACRAGMRTMREHALRKVKDRITTVDEVLRTTIGEVGSHE